MRRLLLPVILIASLLFLACSGDDEPQATGADATSTPPPVATATLAPEPTTSPTPAPEPTATPRSRPEANRFPPDLQEEAEELLQQIVDLRGIPLAEPVDMFLLTREQARDFYARDLPPTPVPPSPGEPTPTPRQRPLDPRQELYELLGFVPPRVEGTDTPDVREQEIDNLISIITGFYDHTYRAFYMIETINGGIYGPLARSTITHELVHALQYQEVDINQLAAERAGNFDAMTALLSVLEGEAVFTEIEILGYSTRSTYREPQCGVIPAPMRSGTPFVIERELDVWYEEGLCFVQAIHENDPENGIAAIWDNVPTTMEQILHPEKYLAGEEAIPVEADNLAGTLGSSWELLGEGVFGEFGLQNLLLPGLAEDRARVQAAAEGWGGDAYRIYHAGGSRLAHLETVWDTGADAAMYRDALQASLVNRGFEVTVQAGPTTRLQQDGVLWAITHRNDLVRILVANDAFALEAALARWFYD